MMNQEDLFKKIGSILQELQDQYDFLAQNPQQLNELELELFQANASFLSDHVQIIKKINNSKPVKELPAPDVELMPDVEPAPVSSAKPVLEELFKPDNEAPTFEFVLKDELVHDKFDFEEKPVYEIFDRPLRPEEEEIIRRKQELLTVQEEQPLTDIPAAPVADATSMEDRPAIPEISLVEVEEELPGDDAQYEPFPLPEEVPVKADESLLFDFTPAAVAEDPVMVDSPVLEQEVDDDPVAEEIVSEEEDEIGPEPFLVVEERPVVPVATEPIAKAVANDTELPVHKPTLNEMLAANAAASNNYSFERSRLPITDLKSAINLNQKLLYIKDLFNGYNLAYAEVIDILNKMPDFKTADHFLQSNYAIKNNWASKPGTVEQFYELLQLRFPD